MTNRVLQHPVRRQLGDRALPAVPRVQAQAAGAERLELRGRGAAREPVPQRGRQRDMVSDGLSIMNADFSTPRSGCRTRRSGAHNFLGNNIAYPARPGPARTACSATKVMVPIDGQVREDVGLLGSPCFEIPRTVARDSVRREGPGELPPPAARPRTGTTRSLRCSCCAWISPRAHRCSSGRRRPLPVHGFGWSPPATVAGLSSPSPQCPGRAGGHRLRRMARGLLDLRPDFWRHERFWKLTAGVPRAVRRHPDQERGVAAAGRPDRPAGVRRRLLPPRGRSAHRRRRHAERRERAAGHSLEDGAFKSDHIVIGPGARRRRCVRALRGDGARGRGARPDVFLMKGQEIATARQVGRKPRHRDLRQHRRPA